MQELIQQLTSPKGFSSLFWGYLNVNNGPKKAAVKKEELLFDAWAATGKHLRKALTQYGQESPAENRSSRR